MNGSRIDWGQTSFDPACDSASDVSEVCSQALDDCLRGRVVRGHPLTVTRRVLISNPQLEDESPSLYSRRGTSLSCDSRLRAPAAQRKALGG